MKEQNNISVIIPVHLLDETTKALFANAVTSVKEQLVRPDELVIVVPKDSDVASYVKTFDFGDIQSDVVIAENDGATDFASQVNFGVATCKSEWFSILEYDDEYANIWFKNVIKYRAAHTDVDIFMPIIVDVDNQSQFIGFTNEAVWANSFSQELGILDHDSLLAYQNFNTDGVVIRKSTYNTYGGLKSNIKLTFIYEFLLRMTLNSVKVMVIPRFGYKHVNQRTGSLFASYKESLNPVEARWWLAQAKKEIYFPTDRKITYEVQNG
jgi:hypothetical protein